jgi:serine/threonine protein kinase/WD40 repeat protein
MSSTTTIVVPGPSNCPECGRVLPDDAPPGLCSNCLQTRGLAGPGTGKPAPIASMTASARLSNYESLVEIARGGMGVVYRARDVKLNRTVALKMILTGHLATGVEVERFKVEAEAAARLEHPNIVPIYEIGFEGGRHFFTMKFVEGGSLGAAIAGRPIDLSRAAALLGKVAHAVHYAHQRGILHRDLKPNNILLDTRGEPLLTDFGLAKIAGHVGALTQSLAVMGSANYMAPEQARGEASQLTTAADVYSLGAVLYETLTGQPPFTGDSIVDILRRVVEEEPVWPSVLNPSVDRDLETICCKCLEKNPAHRYTSAEQLALDLERWLRREPVLARHASTLDRIRKWAKRKPAHAALAAVVLVALMVLTGVRLQYSARLKDRLRTSLMEQARSERLLNHPQASAKLLSEAASIRRDKALRTEAIQTITQPGVSLVFETPFGTFAAKSFSPDGTLYAAGGDVPDWHDGKVVSFPRIRVWKVPSGRLIQEVEWDPMGGPFVFSPNSRILAIPQGSNSIVLLDPRTGKMIGRVPDFGAPLFSPDGTRLAISDGTGVAVFKLSTFKLEQRRPRRAAVRAFLSTDTLLIHEWPQRLDGELRLWNFVTGEERPLNGRNVLPGASANGRIISLLYLNDTNLNTQLVLREAMTGMEMARVPTLQPGIGGSLSPDGRRIAFASPSEPGRFLFWDVPGARLLNGLGEPGVEMSGVFDGYQRLGTSLVSSHGSAPRTEASWRSSVNNFSPDSAFFAGESRFGERNLLLWELGSGRLIATMPGAGRPIWSEDDRWLAVEHDGVNVLRSTNYTYRQSGRVIAQIWKTAHGTPTYRLSGDIRSLVFSRDGRQLAAEDSLWNVEQRGERMLLQRTTGSQREEVVRFAGSEAWGVEASPFRNSSSSRFRPLSTLTNRFEPLDSPRVISHAFTPDGRHLLIACAGDRRSTNAESATTQPHFELWELAQRKRVSVWPHPPPSSTLPYREASGPISFSPDGSLVATGCFLNQGIEIWDIATGKQLHCFAPMPPVTGRKFLGMNIDGFDEKKRNVPTSEYYPQHIAFTPDNHFVVYCAQDRVIIREVDTSRVLARVSAGTNAMNGFALSPDGRTLATGGDDRMIRLWEIPTGRELANWEAHESSVGSLVFSPGGNALASGSREGTLKLWDLQFVRRELAALGLDW